jgi:hypothetical protein
MKISKKIVSHCTHILNNLSIENAKEYVMEKLIPMEYPLTSDFAAINPKDLLSWSYGLFGESIKIHHLGVADPIGFLIFKKKIRYC